MAKLVVLIETTALRGKGTDEDPRRAVTQWYTTDGTLVVERDNWLIERGELLGVMGETMKDWGLSK